MISVNGKLILSLVYRSSRRGGLIVDQILSCDLVTRLELEEMPSGELVEMAAPLQWTWLVSGRVVAAQPGWCLGTQGQIPRPPRHQCSPAEQPGDYGSCEQTLEGSLPYKTLVYPPVGPQSPFS